MDFSDDPRDGDREGKLLQHDSEIEGAGFDLAQHREPPLERRIIIRQPCL